MDKFFQISILFGILGVVLVSGINPVLGQQDDLCQTKYGLDGSGTPNVVSQN